MGLLLLLIMLWLIHCQDLRVISSHQLKESGTNNFPGVIIKKRVNDASKFFLLLIQKQIFSNFPKSCSLCFLCISAVHSTDRPHAAAPLQSYQILVLASTVALCCHFSDFFRQQALEALRYIFVSVLCFVGIFHPCTMHRSAVSQSVLLRSVKSK